jgi:hypothetical protein
MTLQTCLERYPYDAFRKDMLKFIEVNFIGIGNGTVSGLFGKIC